MSSSFVPGANIRPSRFVMLATGTGSQNRTVLECGSAATHKPVGISQEGSHLPPWLTLDDGFAASAGGSLRVYTKDDEEAWLQLGTTVTPGDLLCSDADGRGIVATATGTWVGARALVVGTADQVVKVQPLFVKS